MIKKRILSLALVFVTIISLLSSFSVTASAATYSSKVSCITYNYTGNNAGKSNYVTRYYTIAQNKRVTIQGFWGNETLKNQTSVGIDGKKLKDYLRFDVHIIDPETGKVVNYWYCLKAGDTFKVFSEVPGINAKKYTVKVTSYLSNYRTYKNSNLAGVATNLKYRLKY